MPFGCAYLCEVALSGLQLLSGDTGASFMSGGIAFCGIAFCSGGAQFVGSVSGLCIVASRLQVWN